MDCFHGQFLVAGSRQLDPNFARTVVLVVGHSSRGAFGVVMNGTVRQSARLGQGNTPRFPRGKARLFLGGPVTGPLMAVHTRAEFGEWRLVPGVFFSRKEKNVLALLRRAERPCKLFAGYAGWGPGQLEQEVQQGTWRVVPATPAQIFAGSGDLWQQLSREASRLQLRLLFNIKHVPADPLLN
jgi:putative transcriptional regulator